MTKTDILSHDYAWLITFLQTCQLRFFLSKQEILVMIQNKKMRIIFGNWMVRNPCEYRPHHSPYSSPIEHRTCKLLQTYSS